MSKMITAIYDDLRIDTAVSIGSLILNQGSKDSLAPYVAYYL
jgi:hypothetical protein